MPRGKYSTTPHSRAPAVPVSTGCRCTPTPRSQPIGGSSWSAYSAPWHEAPWRWSVSTKMPVGTSSTRAQSRGLTARPASHCHLSHCSKSWRHSCRCHGSTWSAYGGCLAPHSLRRGAIIPTLRQQGVDGRHTTTASSPWSWARRLQRVFALALTRCPFCQRGALRIVAAITHEAVLTRILRHLTLVSVPPPSAPARSRQETFDWVASAHAIACGLVGDVRATEGCLVSGRHLCAFDIPSPPACPAPRHPWRSPPLPPLAARVQPQGDHAVPLYAWRWGPLAGRPRGAGDAGGAARAAWPLAGGARGLQGAHA